MQVCPHSWTPTLNTQVSYCISWVEYNTDKCFLERCFKNPEYQITLTYFDYFNDNNNLVLMLYIYLNLCFTKLYNAS